MRGCWIVAATLLLAGCAWFPRSEARPASADVLAKADRLAEQGDYAGAVVAYDTFLARFAADSEAPRARMSRETLASLLASREELGRLRQEVARLREELSRQREDLAKREGDLSRARQETERLRTDLERLKAIDLQLERRGTK